MKSKVNFLTIEDAIKARSEGTITNLLTFLIQYEILYISIEEHTFLLKKYKDLQNIDNALQRTVLLFQTNTYLRFQLQIR